MQLEWQVAASSCYENGEEMCGLIGSGASTAAEFVPWGAEQYFWKT